MAEQKPTLFARKEFVKKLDENIYWDIIIIGGGATGLGIAVDAASRGYKTLLLEAYDFAKGTSSRSTKLVHGGVRYLAQGNINLVLSALRERGLLLRNAAHVVKRQSFIIPCYNIFDKWKYLIGLKVYDWLARSLSFGSSTYLTKQEVAARLPNINTKSLIGGIEYFDGQFDDARLAINLAQTAAENGGVLLNYFKVTGISKSNEKVSGVIALDVETQKQYHLNAKAVVNATGIFVNDILKMDEPFGKPIVKASQGIHIVINKSFLKGSSAIMIPKTPDGRVLFAVPWNDHVLVGTTDTPVDNHRIEPVALDKEVQFILTTIKDYLENAPTEKDVLCVFAGLRPLAIKGKIKLSTKNISRDHKILITSSGLITLTGGKWTTYRKMAEDTVNKLVEIYKLRPTPCETKTLKIHGCTANASQSHLSIYGTDASNIEQLILNNPSLNKKLVDRLPYTDAEVIWVVKNEMARTLEDVLARRLRILFLDATAAIECAPRVAEIMARELLYNDDWKRLQVVIFNELAKQYLL
jgi:glycerol-3-phosphate dehydrogenase